MRARRRGDPARDYLSDALAQLNGWTRDGRDIMRTLNTDDAQHAELTERIKVFADALQVRPSIRRLNGCTQITVRAGDEGLLTNEQVTLAARIEDAYRGVTSTGVL
jgi:pterin-4a-carbinolamine dehydratase